MPFVVESKHIKLLSVIFWLCFLVVFVGAALGIVNDYGPVYTWSFRLAFFACAIGVGFLFQDSKSLAADCTEHGYAIVDSIRRCEGSLYVTLMYYVEGEQCLPELKCNRHDEFEIGQEVEIYYDPYCYSVCMLASYKDSKKSKPRKEV